MAAPHFIKQWHHKDKYEQIDRDWDVAKPSFERLAMYIKKVMVHTNADFADFENPNWPYYRAHSDGNNNALHKVLNIISPGEQKNG